ncbi:DUF1569 domain-containing protein [Larkinella punicea]|uniref:DUF1569 domain-containing protein n=1 Tax=Larkinella punicea TaxID=2315727 RepID=A0A368JT99_9BACT|nr:DUF1569 domain-containing protein [Larkinella punicea]RCR70899.1 DUF1569 domain-containing protein [Larkinella punicea]
MDFPNLFTQEVSDKIIQRIDRLTPDTLPLWGKMDVAQMLAHCNVTYELIYENIHKKHNILMQLVIRAFVKKRIVGASPYKRNLPTGPAFLIKDTRNFETEKNRLKTYIRKTQQLGETHFNQKASHSFGKLNVNEWNNMFYKHLDHHLTQFGV